MNARVGGVGGLSLITTAIHVQRIYFHHTCTTLRHLVDDSAKTGLRRAPVVKGPPCSTSGILKRFGL